jgi:hypothetical protein
VIRVTVRLGDRTVLWNLCVDLDDRDQREQAIDLILKALEYQGTQS